MWRLYNDITQHLCKQEFENKKKALKLTQKLERDYPSFAGHIYIVKMD